MIVGRRNPVSNKQRIFRRSFQTTAFNARISLLQPTDVRWSMVFQFVNPTLPLALWLAYRLCVGVYKSVWMMKAIRGLKIRPAKCLKRILPVDSCRQNVPRPMIKVNAFVLPIPMTVDCKPAIQSVWYPILCRVVLRPVSLLRRLRHLLKPSMYRITRCARRSARLLSVS